MNLIRNAAVYARLVKVEHTLFALPFALSALCLADICGAAFGLREILLCVAAFTAARSAAMGFNRIADREFDADDIGGTHWREEVATAAGAAPEDRDENFMRRTIIAAGFEPVKSNSNYAV